MGTRLSVKTGSRWELPRRAAITFGVVAAVLCAERIRLPFLTGFVSHLHPYPGTTIFWLGLTPLLSAYLLVELIAAVVPGLRPLRHGSARERARLTRAAWALGALFAAAQAWSWTGALQGDVVDPVTGWPPLDAGVLSRLAAALALVAATCLLGWLAELISRAGLGNGFAVLVGVACVKALSHLVLRLARAQSGWGSNGKVLALAAAVLVPFIAIHLRKRSRQVGSAEVGPRIPVPTCGLIAIKGPVEILGFPARAAALLPFLQPLAKALRPEDDDVYVWLCIALTLPVAWALSRLFCPPEPVVRAYRRAASQDLGEEGVQEVRRALSSAHVRSLAVALGLAILPGLCAISGIPVWIGVESLFEAAVVIAIVRDMLKEARVRRASPGLVRARQLYRMYTVRPALQALAAAGIPAFARTEHFRVLSHFFAPYAPVDILVAPGHAEQADEICSRVVIDPAPEDPALASAAG